MPVAEPNKKVVNIPLAKKGVNLNQSVIDLSLEECLTSQNMYYRDGMVKRGGQSKKYSTAATASKAGLGLHRFYQSDSTEQIIVASDTTVQYWDGSTWQNVKTGLTAGKQTYFTNWIGSVYIANGTDAPHKWDGSSNSALASAPTQTIQFLPYRDRLLSIDNNNPGDLRWSGSFDDTTWETRDNVGVRPDTKLNGMILHASNDANAGLDAKVLLAGNNGMYLFSGTDLRVPSTTGDYKIDKVALDGVGCVSPRTMVSVPGVGTIWLGTDKEIYLLPFNSLVPVPIGTKIRSNWSGSGGYGIESIPTAQIGNCAAVYHDGFYKLSVTSKGQTANDTQWWLDITRINRDESGLYGPWFGPMVGQKIAMFTSDVGAGGGELIGVEADATVGAYVYTLGDETTYADDSSPIVLLYQSPYNPLGSGTLLDAGESQSFSKRISLIEMELLDVLGDVGVELSDIDEVLFALDDIGGESVYFNDSDFGVEYFNASATSLGGATTYFSDGATGSEDVYFGEDKLYWNDRMPLYAKVQLEEIINARRLSVVVRHSSSSDTFELYNLKVEAFEKSYSFENY